MHRVPFLAFTLALLALPSLAPRRAEAVRRPAGKEIFQNSPGKRLQRYGRGPAAPGPRAVRGPLVFMNFDGDGVFIDHEGDGEFTRLDVFIGNGTLSDTNGREVGTWEGTVTDSSAPTYNFDLTLRLAGVGTITVSGAAYTDGLRSDVTAVPVAGFSGRARPRGNVGVALADDGSFVFALGGVT